MDVRDGSRPRIGCCGGADASHCGNARSGQLGPSTGLPPDWQVAVLMGDPTKAGPYVERVKLPPNAVIPPHTHPDNENITVLSGSFGIGEGEAADKAKGRVLSAGSFYYLPANMAHFAWAGPEGAVVQIHGIGPSGIKMISK